MGIEIVVEGLITNIAHHTKLWHIQCEKGILLKNIQFLANLQNNIFFNIFSHTKYQFPA